jgi:hypothetical protein
MRGRWPNLALAGLALVSLSAFGASHPYQRWAEELGIDTDVSYDGTRVMEMENGLVEVTERRAPGKMYTEMYMANMTTGVILREDLKKSFILMPSMGFYREDSLEDGLMQTSNGLEFQTIEKAGSETINGHPAAKYKTRFKDNNGKGAGVIWVTDTGVPIKMDLIYSDKDVQGQRISMEFTELNLRPQDPGHFEVPDNLKPMTMGNMAGGLGGLMTQQQGAPAAADPASVPADDDAALAAAQQKCLQEAMQSAQDQQKTKRGFGRLLSAATRVADRFGGAELSRATSDVYSADATAADISAAAKDLGLSEDAIEKCKNP